MSDSEILTEGFFNIFILIGFHSRHEFHDSAQLSFPTNPTSTNEVIPFCIASKKC